VNVSQVAPQRRPIPAAVNKHQSFYRSIGLAVGLIIVGLLWLDLVMTWVHPVANIAGTLALVLALASFVGMELIRPTSSSLSKKVWDVPFAMWTFIDQNGTEINPIKFYEPGVANGTVTRWRDTRSTALYLGVVLACLGLLMIAYGVNYFSLV
jgi:hypothetical protein